MSKITELRGKLDERRKTLAEVFEQAGDDYDMSKVTALEGDSAAKAAQIKAMNDEMTELGKEIDGLTELEGIKARGEEMSQVGPHPGHLLQNENGKRPADPHQTLGQLFVESDAYKGRSSLKMGDEVNLDVNMQATLFQTSTGWAPEAVRGPMVVDFPVRQLRVLDLVASGTTNQNAIKYMEVTTRARAATGVAEAGLKPEAAIEVDERTDPVEKIAVWIPVTDEQLEDVPQVQAFIESQLVGDLREELEDQVLAGSGTPPEISGILDRANIQTQAKGADPTPDAIYKAMQKIRTVGRDEPNGVVLHPNDWTPIRLLATADGIYIWGPPMDAGPERIWGVPVVQTTAMTENTGLVGNFQRAQLFMRKGITIDVTNAHDDFFIHNKQAIRAELRAALAVYKPASFCTVTGI